MNNSVVLLAERIAAEILQEQIKTSYQIIGKGFVNQVCVVSTVKRPVVVRINEVNAFPTFLKEKWCIEQATAIGIPGPDVLSIGTIDETAYMIQTFIEGDNGLDSKVYKSDIWRKLGEYARLIQSIPVKGYGENIHNPVQGEFYSPPHPGSDGNWQGYLQYNINSLTDYDPLILLGVLTQIQSKQAKVLLEKLQAQTFRFALHHGDLSLKNTIITPAKQVVLIDWGSAEVNVSPYSSILQLMQDQIRGDGPNTEEFAAFLDGYGMDMDNLPYLRSLLLLGAVDKLRWAIDRRPDLVEAYAENAKKVVDIALV